MKTPALLCLLFALLAPATALAHKPSDSYLMLSIEGGTIQGQWDIALRDLDGSVSFLGKLSKRQVDAYQKLYQATEIRSRSAATRCTWMVRPRARETFWLM